MRTLNKLIENWAAEKGILENGNTTAQAIKTLEECTELLEAVHNKDFIEIADALGDIYVTILIQAKMQGLHLEDCVLGAYNVISKRTGKMIKGQFVKDE